MSNGLYRRIRPDEMESVIERAKKDHPYVRRIEGDIYGVRCGDQEKCSKKAEHRIHFLVKPRGVWALCEDCITNDFHIPHCRHTAAALALFVYYQQAEKQEAA